MDKNGSHTGYKQTWDTDTDTAVLLLAAAAADVSQQIDKINAKPITNSN